MKASELRIGNLINSKKHKKIIACGYKDIANAELGGDGFDGGDHFTAIPLTEEWLLKFGFYKGWGKELRMEITEECSMSYADGIFYIGDGLELNNIKYVHQLQNLYFALTGEELELKK